MTEQEAINALRLEGGLEITGKLPRTIEFFKGMEVAVSALEEIQKYREIGTVEELQKVKEGHFLCATQKGNQTERYVGMIERLECDFSLAMEAGIRHGLDDLQVKIEQGDKQMLTDIELLKELSFGIRHGILKIVKQPEKGGTV